MHVPLFTASRLREREERGERCVPGGPAKGGALRISSSAWTHRVASQGPGGDPQSQPAPAAPLPGLHWLISPRGDWRHVRLDAVKCSSPSDTPSTRRHDAPCVIGEYDPCVSARVTAQLRFARLLGFIGRSHFTVSIMFSIRFVQTLDDRVPGFMTVTGESITSLLVLRPTNTATHLNPSNQSWINAFV